MKGLENQTYLIAYLISNVAALLLLFSSWKWPRLSRLLFFILFAWACRINWLTVTDSAEVYLDYADLAFSEVYRRIVLGWFSRHILPVIGVIATCQGLIAIALLSRGWIYKLGLAGAIVFLLGIIPFGVGSAFPATLTMALGLLLLWNENAFIWQSTSDQYRVVSE
jgi:hypothetical protein